jgi:chromosome segregation ATPase
MTNNVVMSLDGISSVLVERKRLTEEVSSLRNTLYKTNIECGQFRDERDRLQELLNEVNASSVEKARRVISLEEKLDEIEELYEYLSHDVTKHGEDIHRLQHPEDYAWCGNGKEDNT